jgi:membrane protease YdiL (CAAX protease family)
MPNESPEVSPTLPPWGRPERNRLLLWAAIGIVFPGLCIFAFHLVFKPPDGTFSVRTELPVKAIMALFVVLATWIVSRMEKRALDEYGLPLSQMFGKRFWEGCIWGFAMLSAIVLLLCWSGHFQIDSVALTGDALFRYALGWAAVFLAVSISEELAFRGYWLFTFARRLRFWPAALFTSAIFGVAHLGNPGENFLGILQVVVTGLLFCLMIRRTGSLWFALGYHAAWDWAETFFYGTPDSGLIGVGHFSQHFLSRPHLVDRRLRRPRRQHVHLPSPVSLRFPNPPPLPKCNLPRSTSLENQ